jgi:hypothetical protein
MTNQALSTVLILPEYTSYAPWHNPFYYQSAEHPDDRFIARPFVYERGALFDLRQARWDGAAFWPMWATSRNAHLGSALVVEAEHRIRWVAAHVIGERPHDARVELERLDRAAATHQLERLRRFVDARRIGGEEVDQAESESFGLPPIAGLALRMELTSAEVETIHHFLGETK